MAQQGYAAYVQVTNALRDMALAEPWESDGALPAEPVLMDRFGVSRGTLRRATEELAREGLLLVERGRGTTIRRHAQLRAHVRERLAAIAVPDSRWHLDVLRYVPDFPGSDLACRRVVEHPSFEAAALVFVAPDNSLTALVEEVLRSGRKALVPTYAMRRGMVLLDPATVPDQDIAFASTLDGLERFGATLDLEALGALGHVDLVVTGAIAFTTGGIHVGSGTAYLDLEWAILATLGLVDDDTSVLGVAHESQVVDVPLQPQPSDITVDALATPKRLLDTSSQRHRPDSIDRSRISADQLDDIRYLSELIPDHEWIRP